MTVNIEEVLLRLNDGPERDAIIALRRELAEARRSATLIATDTGARRDAAKKTLCDICACAAEADPASLDLPHVAETLAPLETLIAERDACLFMAQQTRRYLGQDGPMVLDAIAEKAAAETRARELLKLLEPFAEAASHLHPAHPDDGLTLDGIEVRHWRAAAQAVAKAKAH